MPVLSPQNRFRVLASLAAEELSRIRGAAVPAQVELGFTRDLPMDEDGIGFDSLGRLDLAARLNQFFHLHEVGIEDYLLIQRALGGWDDIIATSLDHRFERITFQSSGSTGTPKVFTHELTDLRDECVAMVQRVGPVKRIVSYVPPHHIYGFIFTVLLAEHLGVEVVDARALSPSWLARNGRVRDLVVATPHHWRALATACPTLPEAMTGLTSTAPMPSDLARALKAQGLARLVEVYGSSDTAGIATRDDPAGAFELLPRWSRTRDTDTLRCARTKADVPIPDHVEWLDERCLRPAARRDGAFQVGGVNVSPAVVRAALLEHPAVVDCAVRPHAPGGDVARQRVKAFIVLRHDHPDAAELARTLPGWIRGKLPPPARPVSLTFGSSLPLTPMGKLSDW